MNRRFRIGAAAFVAVAALGLSTPAAVQAAAPQPAAAAASVQMARWVTYGHYPTKWQCKAAGKFYTTGKKLAKEYRCVRKVKIGPFKTYRLDLLITWL
ncbi:hypothetical protein ACIBKY_38575 [Nonomuraea sp. NPDC050394]|uniref:hypothetical protein n=1 Tax=Nonomuraea sp. NPDC050394 TaxID=3364363 RepID=UPI0037963459